MLKRHKERPVDRREETQDRGREAEKPTQLHRRGWRDVLKRTKQRIDKDNMSIIAAGVAFYLLLGLVPALVALISIYGLVANPQQIEQHFAAMSGFMPGAVRDMLEEQMKRIASDTGTAGIGAVISILIALWGASKSMKTLITALNVAYEEKEKRGFIKLTLATLALTLAAIIGGILALATIVVLPAALKYIGLDEHANLIANLIRWPLLAALAIFGLAVLYRFAPSRAKPKWRWVTPGSVAAMVLWVIGSALFSVYVSKFANYNKTYGSLGGVVIMMLWLYLTSFVVLLGAELNAEMEHQTAKDTTSSPQEEPMGERHARVADELGEEPE